MPADDGRPPEGLRVQVDPRADLQRSPDLVRVHPHLGPVHGQDKLVVDALADEAEEHEGVDDVVGVQRGAGAHALNGQLEREINVKFIGRAQFTVQ